MISVNLYDSVIYCQDLEASRFVYELLGFVLTQEQHGTGPVHYSFEVDGLLYELYPTNIQPKPRRQTLWIRNESLGRLIRNDRLPVTLEDQARSHWDFNRNKYTTYFLDPDGNRIGIRD